MSSKTTTAGVVLATAMSLSGCGGARVAVDSLASPTAGSPTSTTPTSVKGPALSLAVIGDSIPFNSPEDCPGCAGFVDQYADALAHKTGRQVTTTNRSQHNGVDLPGLTAELATFKEDLSGADVIIIGIAHNSFPLNDERPCGSEVDGPTGTLKDWSKVGPACGEAAAKKYQPSYDQLFSTVAGWRSGKPTILLTVNRYNDWVGWKEGHLTPAQAAKTVELHDAWNAMLCGSAKRNGFTCADIYHAFNGPDGTKPSADLLADDYTHPSQKGNNLIAGVLTAIGFAPLK